jgi:hypothetical protein
MKFINKRPFIRDDGRRRAKPQSGWSCEVVGMTEPAKIMSLDRIGEAFAVVRPYEDPRGLRTPRVRKLGNC